MTLVLDDGKRIKASAGDVVVQRGTIHEWLNEGDEWNRVYFVLIRACFCNSHPKIPPSKFRILSAAKKVKIGENALEMEFRSKEAT